MINLGKTHDTLSVVNDQIGTPTYTYDLARLLVDMIETEKYGYYHATNEGGYISWYDFTKEIFRQAAAMGHPEYLPENMTVNSPCFPYAWEIYHSKRNRNQISHYNTNQNRCQFPDSLSKMIQSCNNDQREKCN